MPVWQYMQLYVHYILMSGGASSYHLFPAIMMLLAVRYDQYLKPSVPVSLSFVLLTDYYLKASVHVLLSFSSLSL